MALIDIDTSDAGELNEGFEPFAPGEYTIYLENSERKATKNADGEYLNCIFVVAEGENKDRKIFHMFNLWNKSQQAVEIAKSQFRALCEATVGQPNAPGNDSASLHFKPFIATIVLKPAEGNFKAKNEIAFRKGQIRPVGVYAGAGQPQAQPQQQPAQQATVVPMVSTPQGAAVAATPVAAGVGSRPAWAKR